MENPLFVYRKLRGLSQEGVAALLGVSRQMVGLLEQGERKFTAEMAVKIEQRLGIDRTRIRPDLFKRKA